MISPDSRATACPPSGRSSTYRPVQISGTGSRFKQTVLGVVRRNKPVMVIRTYSPGGALYDGMEIGRMVRRLRAITIAPNLAQGSNEIRTCYAERFGGEFTYDPRTSRLLKNSTRRR